MYTLTVLVAVYYSYKPHWSWLPGRSLSMAKLTSVFIIRITVPYVGCVTV